MCDENSNRMTDESGDRNRLRLVDRSAQQKKVLRLSEPAATELRELIGDVRRHTPRKRQAADDDTLPPAA